ncbi:zinc finger BED domain-containing protein 5 [Trichonephila inaurata madagascariensis]|uniref:Zinc finger BED domain-containing protein 5 n=1 Tax=Trichonephila inaurata madagascariensis TaxID=2747483 RepID=A0A8X7CA16_9ARAC|nr:zinc finger BED domain-containing protein 5 [Trichonephila inaurata madagascariensis]
MLSTCSSVTLQPHLLNPPSSNFGEVVSTKRRKYYTKYLSIEFTRFTNTGDEEAPTAVCLLCNKIFANSILAPAKLLSQMEKIY